MITAIAESFRTKPNENLFHQALISSIDDVVISTDRNFIIKTWNAAAEKIYEINAHEAIGQKMSDILLHEYIDTTEEQAQKKLVFENYWKGIVKLISKSGKVTFLQSIITTVRDKNDKKIGYVGVSRDITKDLSVKQSLRNFESILTVLDETFLIVDSHLKIVFMRAKGNAQKFFNSDYQVGDNALKYIPSEYIDIVKESYTKAFSGETINYDAVSDTETKYYINVTFSPLKDSFNPISNVCVIIKDQTAQKEIEFLQGKEIIAEKNLFESRKFFENFMENSPMPAWVTDEKGYIQYTNLAYLNVFDFTQAVIGKNIFELYPEEIAEEYFENNKIVIETGNAIEAIEKGNSPAKSATYKIVKFPIFFKGSMMIAGWSIDISDQISAHESLSLLNQNKDKIVSVIAHDIRAPLGTNRNLINTIIQDYDILEEEELMEYLTLMRNSLTKCYNLTEEILLWARNQLKTITYKPAELEADIEVSKVIENLIYVAEDKKISIVTEFCKSDKIFCDHDMFAIVARNFISNAIKFSTPGSSILISTNVVNDKMVISVKDTGVGIKKELVEKLLRKLNYESTFGTKGEKGAGLGLIIAKDYIDRNNGEMFIESEEGKGSIFSFAIGFKKTP